MPTMMVTVRELRLRLSEYLRKASRGETIVVTNRGNPVAELRIAREGKSELREPRAAYLAGREPEDDARVGVRALKANLPHYLRIVSSGKRVVVTDRERVTAELRPVAVDLTGVIIPDYATPEDAARMRRALVEDPPPPEMMALLRRGDLVWKGRFRVFPPRIKTLPGEDDKTFTDYLREMRNADY